MRCLVANGAAIDSTDNDGYTALMCAASVGQLASMRALVELGADTAVTNNFGETAMEIARQENHTHVINWLRRCAALPALHRLCDRRADEDDIAELLRGRADPVLRSAAGETPLQICRLADAALGALPARKETTDVIAAAVKPWHRKRHGLFPRTFTPRVVLVLLVQQRLDGQAALFEQQQAQPMRQTRRRRRLGAALRVRLTVEIWLQSVVPFLPRFGGSVDGGVR